MNTVSVKCNLCGADDYSVLHKPTINGALPTVEDYTSTVNRYGSFHRIVACKKCGLVYMNPRDSGIKSYYSRVRDDAYLASWQDRASTFREHLRILRPYAPSGARLLDIGCYAGIFPDEAARAGYDVTAIEPSGWAADEAAARTKARIIRGSWDEAALPQGHFDVVTMWDTIEHLEDPSGCLARSCGWLKNNGIIAVSTHNIKSFFARAAARRYPWLMRFHLYHFEPKTLSAMLEKNGMKTIAKKSYVKKFSLEYISGRLGVKTLPDVFKKIRVPLHSGDMFIIIAEKKCA